MHGRKRASFRLKKLASIISAVTKSVLSAPATYSQAEEQILPDVCTFEELGGMLMEKHLFVCFDDEMILRDAAWAFRE